MSEGIVPDVPPAPAASVSANKDQPKPGSDNDTASLIITLQKGFQELIDKQEQLSKTQSEQSERYFVHLRREVISASHRIHKAVEALKPQAPVADKKTTFWNGYMKLADEYDKDFQQIYSTDLNTGLIFAGLFSAVSSAFIILIQPEFAPDTQPSTQVVVAQSLLYMSLFATLLASLLAVLGMQWLTYYQAAGSRGTIEERRLERQRKLGGLHKWKLVPLLQIFPLLLQLALLLFATALSVYLWGIHRSLAIIVLVFTLIGFGAYLFLLGSAIMSDDSPFQTPLADFLSQLADFLSQLIHALPRFLIWTILNLVDCIVDICAFCCCPVEPRANILPKFRFQTSSNTSSSIPAELAPSDPTPSDEVPAVLWILETSTDPVMITAAADIAIDLQWSLDVDLTSSMARLVETFQSCFFMNEYQLGNIRTGMIHRAIACGAAYCELKLVSVASGDHPPSLLNHQMNARDVSHDDPAQLLQLSNIIRIAQGWPDLIIDSESLLPIPWALHVIPSIPQFGPEVGELIHFLDQFPANKMPMLDPAGFADYLCCINSFLSTVDPRVVVQINKSPFIDSLIIQLLNVLLEAGINNIAITRILQTTSELGKGIPVHNRSLVVWAALMRALLQFCGGLPRTLGWLDAVISATMLIRFEDFPDVRPAQESLNEAKLDMEWIYLALEHVQHKWENNRDGGGPEQWDSDTTLTIDALLRALVYSGPPGKPSLESLRIILRALSAPGDISVTAFRVLCNARTWFLDPELQPTMQDCSVWSHLGRVALKVGTSRRNLYIGIGANIANSAFWKPFMYQDLSSWIQIWSPNDWGSGGSSWPKFTAVICDIWVPDFDKDYKFTDETEKSWALAITALSNVWEKSAFAATACHDFIRLARCTVSTVLQVRYIHRLLGNRYMNLLGGRFFDKSLQNSTRATFSSRLSTSLIQATRNARNAIPTSDIAREDEQAFQRVIVLLETLGQKIGADFEPGSGEVKIGECIDRTPLDQYKLRRGKRSVMTGEVRCKRAQTARGRNKARFRSRRQNCRKRRAQKGMREFREGLIEEHRCLSMWPEDDLYSNYICPGHLELRRAWLAAGVYMYTMLRDFRYCVRA
ncbi:hypothetical protein DFH09DRAFT_1289161 [Mycena vulgaris]|nr:hypothetical protein DFH09DRAFT_1289161 [Mycena vulgaris]